MGSHFFTYGSGDCGGSSRKRRQILALAVIARRSSVATFQQNHSDGICKRPHTTRVITVNIACCGPFGEIAPIDPFKEIIKRFTGRTSSLCAASFRDQLQQQINFRVPC